MTWVCLCMVHVQAVIGCTNDEILRWMPSQMCDPWCHVAWNFLLAVWPGTILTCETRHYPEHTMIFSTNIFAVTYLKTHMENLALADSSLLTFSTDSEGEIAEQCWNLCRSLWLYPVAKVQGSVGAKMALAALVMSFGVSCYIWRLRINTPDCCFRARRDENRDVWSIVPVRIGASF